MGTPVIPENPNLSHFLNYSAAGLNLRAFTFRILCAGVVERDETGRGVFASINLDLASVRPITVAGLTIARASRRSGQKLEARTQNQRSDGCSRGRGVFQFSTARCQRITKL
jgi:hypothetical protein